MNASLALALFLPWSAGSLGWRLGLLFQMFPLWGPPPWYLCTCNALGLAVSGCDFLRAPALSQLINYSDSPSNTILRRGRKRRKAGMGKEAKTNSMSGK